MQFKDQLQFLNEQHREPLTEALIYTRQKEGVFSCKDLSKEWRQVSELNKGICVTKFDVIVHGPEQLYINGSMIHASVQSAEISPCGTFVIVQSKGQISIYCVESLQLLAEFTVSGQHSPMWDSTNSLIFIINKQIEVYETAGWSLIRQIEYMDSDIAISRERDFLRLSQVTLSQCMTENQSEIRIYDYNSQKSMSIQLPVTNECKQFWNKSKLLLWTQQFDDRSNQSYFGVHHLYLVTDKLTAIRTFPGPIHDVKWKGDDFIAISGYMPAGVVLYNNSGVQQILILQEHVNIMHIHEDVILLAGFGNLSGDVFLYNTQTMQKMAQFKKDKVTQVSFSPCGNYILLVTAFPRLRVDNQINIYSIKGEHLYQQHFQELYEAAWQPGAKPVIQQMKIPITQPIKEVQLQGFGMNQLMLDFIKEMKNKTEFKGPRKLQPDEQLGEPIQIEKPVDVVPQKIKLMRRQEPLVDAPVEPQIQIKKKPKQEKNPKINKHQEKMLNEIQQQLNKLQLDQLHI